METQGQHNDFTFQLNGYLIKNLLLGSFVLCLLEVFNCLDNFSLSNHCRKFGEILICMEMQFEKSSFIVIKRSSSFNVAKL